LTLILKTIKQNDDTANLHHFKLFFDAKTANMRTDYQSQTGASVTAIINQKLVNLKTKKNV